MRSVSITTMGRDTLNMTIKKGSDSIKGTFGRPTEFRMVSETISFVVKTGEAGNEVIIKEVEIFTELKPTNGNGNGNGNGHPATAIDGKVSEYEDGGYLKTALIPRQDSPSFDATHQVDDIEGIYETAGHGNNMLKMIYGSKSGKIEPKAESDILNTINKYADFRLNKVPLESGATAIYIGGLTYDCIPVRIKRQQIAFGTLLTKIIERNCSDLHLQVGAPPTFREIGRLNFLDEYDELSYPAIMDIIHQLIDTKQMHRFEEDLVLNFAREFPGVGRARVNIFFQRGSPAMAMRFIPRKIPTFEQLHLPKEVRMMTNKHKGLVLVTGATGSGKTTTLATMIDKINADRAVRIITIEDPIEFRYDNNKSVICQREVGMDCKDFHDALHECTRQNPDIMLIGEIRDYETAEVAMRAAETGHLVYGTLHSTNAVKTLERLTGLLKEGGSDEKECYARLSEALTGVISQELVPNKSGTGRIPLTEVLTCEKWVAEYIKEADTMAISSTIDSRTEGMRSYKFTLWELIREGLIDESIGEARIDNWRPFKQTLTFREYPYSSITAKQ